MLSSVLKKLPWGDSLLDIYHFFGLFVDIKGERMRISSASACISSLFILTSFALAQGGSSVSQTVSLEVKPISQLVVSGSPAPLVINDAVAGSELTSVSDDNTKYSVTTNLDNMKIVVSISDLMPVGTKLMINLSSEKGMSRGSVDVSGAISPVEVVSGLSKGRELDQSIQYIFAANATAGQVPTQTRIITLTLTN